MEELKQSTNCVVCEHPTSENELKYSHKKFALPVCYSCQKAAEALLANPEHRKTTPKQVAVFLALLRFGLEAKLEYPDKNIYDKEKVSKRVDIAITSQDVKLYLEVDGEQHHCDAVQVGSDFERDYYSFLNGYLTLHLPNAALENNFRYVIAKVIEIAKNLKNVHH